MNFMPVPKEIEELHSFIKISLKKQDFKNVEEFKNKFKVFLEYLKNLYASWFPKARDYTDEHLTEEVYALYSKKQKNKVKAKYKMQMLIRSSERVFYEALRSKGSENYIDSHKLKLLKEFVFETVEFLDVWSYYISGKNLGYKWRKRAIANSVEIFSAAAMLLKRRVEEEELGGFVIIPTSIFLLRQSIEIRLKNAFGVSHVLNQNGKLFKISGNCFLELVEEFKSFFDLPVKFSLIKKIYAWTNYYIHGGFIHYIWEIEWAHFILRPLFEGEKVNNTWNQFGSIKISKYEELKKKVVKYLEDEKEWKGEICWLPKPEATILS